MSDLKLISTTALAKKNSLMAKDLFLKFYNYGFIDKDEADSWILTQKGISFGGTYLESKQYGKYIAWPENIDLNNFKIEKNFWIDRHDEIQPFKDSGDTYGYAYFCTDNKTNARTLLEELVF